MATKALLIGGTRFVGYRLLLRLVQAGFNVTVLNRGLTRPEAVPTGVRHLRCDRHDHARLRALLAEVDCDVVFDTCGYVPEDVDAVLQALRSRIAQYIFVSSCVVYRHFNGQLASRLPLEESDPLEYALLAGGDNSANYAPLKARTERLLLENGAVAATIFRTGGIYGRNDEWYRHDYFFDRIQDRRPILIPRTEVDRLFHLTYVESLARACIAAVGNRAAYNEVFNIVDDTAISCADFARLCMEVAGQRTDLLTYDGEAVSKLMGREGSAWMPRAIFPFHDSPSYALHCQKAAGRLAWAPMSLRDGSGETYRWFEERRQAGTSASPDYRLDDALLRTAPAAWSPILKTRG
jgi:nucleoside-diphosphate-sugar epimerase